MTVNTLRCWLRGQTYVLRRHHIFLGISSQFWLSKRMSVVSLQLKRSRNSARHFLSCVLRCSKEYSSNSSSNIRFKIGVYVVGTPGYSGAGIQNCWFFWSLLFTLGNSLSYTTMNSVLWSMMNVRIEGLTSLNWPAVPTRNSGRWVLVVVVYGNSNNWILDIHYVIVDCTER